MGFQIKNFASITAGMLNWLRSNTTKITDLNVGSVARTMLEASAIEMEELYLQYFIGLQEAIPVSVFNTFGFAAIGAESASGIIRFTTATPATANIPIPAGTVVKAPIGGQSFVTLGPASILIGQTYVDVLSACQTPGAAGNCDSDQLTQLVTAIGSVSTVTNPQPIINGRDAETDDERKVRFQGYITTLARGTKASIEYGARTAKLFNSLGVVTEYVAYAGVVEPWVSDSTQPVSLIYCYVHNGASATSPELVSLAQQVVDGQYSADGSVVPGTGWKAAGVKCIVAAASDIPVDVDGEITVAAGFESSAVLDDCTAAVKAYLQGLNVGAPVLLAELIAILKRDVRGVDNVSLADPTTDTAIAANAKATAGTVTLVEA